MAGPIRRDSDGKIKFPTFRACGGLYRFLVRRFDGSRATYVGETDNLQRRFSHYRNPGPTQLTNVRINALFVGVLSDGGSIEVEVIVDHAWIKIGETEVAADFSRKDVRRLFENFILATQKIAEVEDLNK